MTVTEIYNLFNQVNKDCEESDEYELVVPITKENVHFYLEQMSNLEFSVEDMIAFENFLLG